MKEKIEKYIKLFLKFLKALLPYKKKYFFILLSSGLSSILALVNPYLVKLIIDNAIKNNKIALLIILVLIGACSLILSALFEALRYFLENFIKIKVNFDLNRKVLKHIKKLPLSWFQDKSTGEHIYKINYDIEKVTDFITTILPQVISLLLRVFFALAIIFLLNWKMAILSILLAPLLCFPPYYFGIKIQKVWKELIESLQDIFKNLSEFFSHIALVKTFGKEASGVHSHITRLINNIRIHFKNIKLEIKSRLSLETLKNMAISSVVFYGGYLVINNEVSLGTLSAIIIYLVQLMTLQGQLAQSFQITIVGLVSCERIAQILDSPQEPSLSAQTKTIIFKKGEILFKNVSFGYNKKEYILKDITFNIDGGKHIALAGPSGCGKTTIVYLLLGLYFPWEGKIYIDGNNIWDIKPVYLRDQIGVVPQEPFLWNTSVIDNIKYAKKNAKHQEIYEVAHIVGADIFIKGLPEGYNTIIGENACMLSEGQKQRISIARTLIKKPRILIFDEAFSSIDFESEDKIMRNIKANFKEITIINITHRLSSIKELEFIYFINKKGEIIADTPMNLTRNEEFANLFRF